MCISMLEYLTVSSLTFYAKLAVDQGTLSSNADEDANSSSSCIEITITVLFSL